MKARSCVRFLAMAEVEAISPLPGRGTTWSTRSRVLGVPDSSSWTGSLLVKPVAASTAPCASAVPWPKSGYSWMSRSDGFSPADASSAWSMIQLLPYLPGVPSLRPRRSAAVLMPLLRFAYTTLGNWA